MYGTVTRYRLKPGTEAQALSLSDELTDDPPPGYIGGYTYRLDEGSNEYITATVWTDRDTYRRTSNSERQERWFERVAALLVEPPEWNDGEVLRVSKVPESAEDPARS